MKLNAKLGNESSDDDERDFIVLNKSKVSFYSKS